VGERGYAAGGFNGERVDGAAMSRAELIWLLLAAAVLLAACQMPLR